MNEWVIETLTDTDPETWTEAARYPGDQFQGEALDRFRVYDGHRFPGARLRARFVERGSP